MVRLEVKDQILTRSEDFISIPLWYGLEVFVQRNSFLDYPISIPLWYDQKTCNPDPLPVLDCISIPLWYDQKLCFKVSRVERARFQFHYGTIRSTCLVQSLQYIFISIPLWYDQKLIILKSVTHLTYFNSTMVRLEAYTKMNTRTQGYYFNSTMVRLEVSAQLSTIRPTTFQFHYGTIRSGKLDTVAALKANFNSTMVRLEVIASLIESCWACISIPLWYDQKLHTYPNWRYLCNFNSTMVRLEEILDHCHGCKVPISIPLWYDQKRVLWLERLYKPLFQFHYGTIRRNRVVCFSICMSHFNSTMVRLEAGNSERSGSIFRISIPLWYDQKGIRVKQYLTDVNISIPLWYDQKFMSCKYLIWVLFNFNSTMVRLEGDARAD